MVRSVCPTETMVIQMRSSFNVNVTLWGDLNWFILKLLLSGAKIKEAGYGLKKCEMGRTSLLREKAEYEDMLRVYQVCCSTEWKVVSNIMKIQITVSFIVLMCI